MDYKIGDVMESDGAKRKVIGFSVINGVEYPNTELVTESIEDALACQYCGKECKSALGLNSHERACKENPENKGGE